MATAARFIRSFYVSVISRERTDTPWLSTAFVAQVVPPMPTAQACKSEDRREDLRLFPKEILALYLQQLQALVRHLGGLRIGEFGLHLIIELRRLGRIGTAVVIRQRQ
jgi:hypothetical protein